MMVVPHDGREVAILGQYTTGGIVRGRYGLGECGRHRRDWQSAGRRAGVMTAAAVQVPASSLRKMLLPLALAQFICSFAGSNMNVMITDISADLHTDVQGVQVCITLFLLVMAALMIPCGKLTDRLGRKRCFILGLWTYGIGAVLSAVAPGLGVLILGNSILEGVGTALLIPPVYILVTILFHDMRSRARRRGGVNACQFGFCRW